MLFISNINFFLIGFLNINNKEDIIILNIIFLMVIIIVVNELLCFSDLKVEEKKQIHY